jgi:hypothetical protein
MKGENCSLAATVRCDRFAATSAILERSARLNRAISIVPFGPPPPLDRQSPKKGSPTDMEVIGGQLAVLSLAYPSGQALTRQGCDTSCA